MSTRIDSSPAGAADVCLPSDAPTIPTTEYVVKAGDTLSKLADGLRKEGLPGTRDEVVQQLLDLNPQVTDKNLIHVGQQLTLPKPPEAKPAHAESNHVESFSPNASYGDPSTAACVSEGPTYSAAMLMMSGAPAANEQSVDPSVSAQTSSPVTAPGASAPASGPKKPSGPEKKKDAPKSGASSAQAGGPKNETKPTNSGTSATGSTSNSTESTSVAGPGAEASKLERKYPHTPDGTPMYAQSDRRWADTLIGNDKLYKDVKGFLGITHKEERSHAMAAIGCAVTGSAAAISKELGYEVTPGDLARTGNALGGFGKNDGINWVEVGKEFGLQGDKSALSKRKLDDALDFGHVVLIDVNHSSEKLGTPDHWIAVTRKDDRVAGRYWAMDPALGREVALRMNQNGQLESEAKIIGLRKYLTTGDMVTFTPTGNLAEFHPSNAPLK